MLIFLYFSIFLNSVRRHISAVLLLVAALCASAQNGITGHPDWQVKPVVSYGFVLIHRISIGHLVKGYPVIYELNLSKPTLGNKLWQRENNQPDLGITLQCIDFRNAPQLGYGLVAAPYIELPLSARARASRLVMRLSWGATYLTKKFDIAENHKNIAIGSHLNCFVQFRWFWHLQLSKQLRFEPGLTFTHASNGRFKNPNLGLNVVSLSAGLNYLLPSAKPRPALHPVDSSTKARSKHELLVYAAVGFNQREILGDELRVVMASVAYQRNVRNTHKFSAGLDVFYDQNYQLDVENEFGAPPSGLERLRIAPRLGYAYNIGRISLPIELGYYLHQKSYPDGYVVSRIGVRYYTRCGLVAQFGLRTHFAVAYNFEYGLGYRFPLGH